MSLALYTLTAAALLALVHRFVRPISRWSAIALFAIPLAFVGYALLTGRVYGPVDLPYLAPPMNWMKQQYGLFRLHNGYLSDIYAQMIPWRKALQWSLQQGQWPLWNPFILSGDILAASGQPAAYSPFTLLALLLPVAHSLTFSAATTHLIAALGAFLVARELGCRESAALVAAAGWSLSTAIGLFVLWPLGASWAWLPWVLVAVRGVVRCSSFVARDEPRTTNHEHPATLLTIVLTLLLLSGHPETALHVVFLGVIYGIFELRSGWSTRVVVQALIAGVVALLLSAIYILPILEAAPQTMEHPYRQEVFAKQDRGVDTKVAMTRLVLDLFPQEHGRGEMPIDSAAVGSIILALATYAVWRTRSAHTWFFAGMALFGLLAHCEWRPLARALQKLPLFDIALNERFSFGAACALSILAALGVEELCRRGQDRAAVFTLVLVLIAITIVNLRLKPNDRGWGDYTIAAEIGFLALATLVVCCSLFVVRKVTNNEQRTTNNAATILLALLIAQRIISAGGMYLAFDPAVAYPPIPILEPTRHVKEPFRITGHGFSFVPGTSALYELEDIRGYQAMTFLPYVATFELFARHQPVWFNRVDDLERPFLSFLNVRFAITWDQEPPRAGWVEVARQRGSVLLENTRVIERAFVPRHVRLGKSVHETLEEMKAETDFRERAWIRAELPPHERGNGPGHVTNIRWRKLGYDLDADMQGDGWVVLSIPAWTGWRAYIDGRRVETQVANHAFLSVFVPRGGHHVRFAYWPRSFVIGRGITFGTLVALIAVVVIRRRYGPPASRRRLGQE